MYKLLESNFWLFFFFFFVIVFVLFGWLLFGWFCLNGPEIDMWLEYKLSKLEGKN